MATPLDLPPRFTAAVLTIILATAVVYLAARWVLDKSSFWASLGTVVVGTLLATIILDAVGGTLGIVLAAATWALVAALLFGTHWIKGAIVGLVAWVLWALLNWAIDQLR